MRVRVYRTVGTPNVGATLMDVHCPHGSRWHAGKCTGERPQRVRGTNMMWCDCITHRQGCKKRPWKARDVQIALALWKLNGSDKWTGEI